jgi:hypothetical protein
VNSLMHRFVGRRVGAGLAAGALVGSVLGVVIAGTPASAATTVNCPSGNLQDAIDAAAPGTNLSVSGTCTGRFTIPKELTLTGPATLDGGGRGPVVRVLSGVTAKLRNLTVQNGNTPIDGGGGISNAGNLTLDGTTVTHNHADSTVTISHSLSTSCASDCSLSNSDQIIALAGGGIFNTGTLTVTSSTVSANTASGDGTYTQTMTQSCVDNCSLTMVGLIVGNAGGGIANVGGTVNLKSSTVTGNSASGTGNSTQNQSQTCNNNCSMKQTAVALGNAGGGIFNHAGTVNLYSSTVSGNSASGARTISYNPSASCSGTCPISESVTVDGGGGGIFNDGTLNVKSAMVLSNSSSQNGGGIANSFFGVASVYGSTLSTNSANNLGGGINNFGNLMLKSDTISGNSAGTSGGGVHNLFGTVTQSGNTYSGNTPDDCNGC